MAELKRYLRLRAGSASWDGSFGWKQWRTYIKFGADSFFSQLCAGAISADNEQSGHPATAAGDYVDGSYWHGIGDGQSIVFDLADDIADAGSPSTWSSIRIYSDYYTIPKIVRVDFSDDGLTWTNQGGWAVDGPMWGYVDGEWIGEAFEWSPPGESDFVAISPDFAPEILAGPAGHVVYAPTRDVCLWRVTLTGDGEAPAISDIEIPVSQVTARLRSGSPSTLSVTVPGLEYAAEIAARSNGDLVLEHIYQISFDGVETSEIVLSAHLTGITPYEGTDSRSIVLAASQQYTHANSDVAAVTGLTSRAPNQTDNRYTWTLTRPVVGLRPVMSASYDGITIDLSEIQISASPTSTQVYLKEA